MRYKGLRGLSRLQVFSIAGIILILSGTAGFFVYKQKNAAAKLNTRASMQASVDVALVQRTDLVKRISLTGQTVPEAQIDIAPKYQGRVTAVNVALGQKVSAGDVLVIQDTRDADLTILQNQAAYEQAAATALSTEATVNANYDRAKADYQRMVNSYQRSKTLYDIGGISKESLDASEQQLADAKAALDTLTNQVNNGVSASILASRAAADKADKTIKSSEKQRDDLVIRAPRSGVIGYRQVEVGALIPAGQKILSIYDTSNLYVDCQVSEQDLGAFSLGLSVDIQIDSLGKSLPGKLIYVSPASDATNLTYMLRFSLVNPDPIVRGGMFARSIINVPIKKNVLVISKDAILEKNGANYVFVVGDDNVIEQRLVEVGTRSDENVEILKGLNEGEAIALTNLARLNTGVVITPNVKSEKG